MKYLPVFLFLSSAGFAQIPNKVQTCVSFIKLNGQFQKVDSCVYNEHGKMTFSREYEWYGDHTYTDKIFSYTDSSRVILSAGLVDSTVYDAQHRVVSALVYRKKDGHVFTDKKITYQKNEAHIVDGTQVKVLVQTKDKQGRLTEERLYNNAIADSNLLEKSVYNHGKKVYRRLPGGALLLYTEEQDNVTRSFELSARNALIEEIHTYIKADTVEIVRYKMRDNRLAVYKREVTLPDKRGLKTSSLYYQVDAAGRERLYQEMKYEWVVQ